jgi:ribosomal protein L7/L12
MHTEQEVYELRQRVEKLERQVAALMQAVGLHDAAESAAMTPEILDLVRRGDKLKAIRLYREATGAPLKAAKAYIDSLG